MNNSTERISLTETLEIGYAKEEISYISKIECTIIDDSYSPHPDDDRIIARATLRVYILYNDMEWMLYDLPISGIFRSCSRIIIKSACVSAISEKEFMVSFVIAPLSN